MRSIPVPPPATSNDVPWDPGARLWSDGGGHDRPWSRPSGGYIRHLRLTVDEPRRVSSEARAP
jgi:hypothetical protein